MWESMPGTAEKAFGKKENAGARNIRLANESAWKVVVKWLTPAAKCGARRATGSGYECILEAPHPGRKHQGKNKVTGDTVEWGSE